MQDGHVEALPCLSRPVAMHQLCKNVTASQDHDFLASGVFYQADECVDGWLVGDRSVGLLAEILESLDAALDLVLCSSEQMVHHWFGLELVQAYHARGAGSAEFILDEDGYVVHRTSIRKTSTMRMVDSFFTLT